MSEIEIETLRAERDLWRKKAGESHDEASRYVNKMIDLELAARKVLSFREGDLPGKGWLRDNSGSREALAKLAAVVSQGA